MTRQKTFVKGLCFMTTSGVSAFALVLATLPLFESARVVAADRAPAATAVSRPAVKGASKRVAQVQAQVPVQATAPVSTPIPTQAPTVANPNQDPFRLGAANEPVANPAANPVATNPVVANPNAALATSGPASAAPIARQAATPSVDQITQLRARIQTLQAQLRHMPTSLEEQQAQQKTVEEIAALQNQIQQLEVNGQFANYRQFRQAADAQQDPLAQQPFGAPVPNVLDPNNPLTPIQQSRQQTLDASGLNAANLANRLDPNVQGEVGLLMEQREGLLQQYRQIQQTLRACQPGDQALADSLKQEQATLLEQLRDIESRLNAAQQNQPQMQNANPGVNPNDISVVPPANRLPNVQEPAAGNSDVAVRMQKVEQAARLLQEAGLVLLANYALNEAPRLADPNFKETQLVPGAWAEGDGLAEARHNPFQQITEKDIDGINTSIDDLKTRVDSLTETLANVEAQLKLLTRNSVAEPVVTPAAEPVVTPNAPEETPEIENAPSVSVEPVAAPLEPTPVPTSDDEEEPIVPETESLPEVDSSSLQPTPLVPSPLN